MEVQDRLNDAALHAPSTAVDQAHLGEPGLVRGVKILLDDRRDVARPEGVQVDGIFDGDAVGHG